MPTTLWILTLLIVSAATAAVTYFLLSQRELRGVEAAKNEADRIVQQSRTDAESQRATLLIEAREQALALKAEAEHDVAAIRKQQLAREQKLDRRDELLTQQEESLQKQRRGLEATQTRLAAQLKQVHAKQADVDATLERQREALEQVSGMTREAAGKQLIESMQRELEGELGALVLRHERRVAETLDARSREMLLVAIQRYASAHTADSTTSTVDIPNDDMKGRIIGREGRNVRAFEKATGVDVIIDDTPGVVIVSGFDPVRREIARMSLEKLIDDGRIHPSRIEEIVAESIAEIDTLVLRKGREAAEETNVPGVSEKVLQMLGRLHFRTSYSQNVLRHSVEVAFISGLLAEMLGMDAALARRAGLLHDIGKAADHELEGGHPKIGADILRRNNEPPEVVHAALGHHDQIITEYPYTMLVATADACSASRPGARRESLERYVKRMEELEHIAKRFDGVQQAFAIQAGRELRVIVNADRADDKKAAKVCREIAKAFEQELTYPGEIKVTVVRETRFVETAK
ncbi:MAG: ribonuclease Y [Planctomycetaceae bacterium]